MAKVKERPIIFNTEMVRAILDNRKTQTRRVVKPQPQLQPILTKHTIGFHQQGNEIACPYGQPGDRLWVRETLMVERKEDLDVGNSSYLADRECIAKEERKVPAIHMPRWASRITLEIVRVRVERVQDINEQDAIAEGCVDYEMIPARKGTIGGPAEYKAMRFPIGQYARLWDSINAKRGFGWQTNPWVWVVEFIKLK